MGKKEDTPMRIARRNYEEKNLEERKETTITWGTRISRKDGEEINAFLEKSGVSGTKFTKVDLIYAGYLALQERYSKRK